MEGDHPGEFARRGPEDPGRHREWASGSRNHSTNAEIPDCATSPIQDRSCAESFPNQGSFSSIAAIAAVANAPVAPCKRSARAFVAFATS